MSKFEKAKKRILLKPKDYTYTEAKYFLWQLGFEEYNKGKTSGSRVKFIRESDKRAILLHKLMMPRCLTSCIDQNGGAACLTI